MASILLIDDSATVHALVSATLAVQGHSVTVSSDMRHGVKALRASRFDLIIMDLNMPDVRGEAGVKLLRQRLEVDTPIVILSGEITIQTVVTMKPFGVSGFVAKGDDFAAKLVQEVSRALTQNAEEG